MYAVHPHVWLDTLFPYFHQSDLMVFDLSIQNVQPHFGYLLNVTAIQRFVFCLWHHNRNFFLRISLVSKAGLSRLKQTCWKFFIPYNLPIHGLWWLQNELNTHTLICQINYTYSIEQNTGSFKIKLCLYTHATCFSPFTGRHPACWYKSLTKKDVTRWNLRGPLFTATAFSQCLNIKYESMTVQIVLKNVYIGNT